MPVIPLEPSRIAQLRVAEVRGFLGCPSSELELQATGTPFFYQAIWPCGCSIEFVHEEQGAYSHEPCSDHLALAADERLGEARGPETTAAR